MYIVLNFQISKKTLYIPDGYVYDLNVLKNNFLRWMEEQPECILHNKKHGYYFNEETFLKYVNDVILVESVERAYFTPLAKTNIKKIPTVSF